MWDPKNRKVVRLDENSLYKENFGGKSVEKEWIGDEREVFELDDGVERNVRTENELRCHLNKLFTLRRIRLLVSRMMKDG